MNAETIRALNAINREFYSTFATDFSRSRAHPWPGWSRVVDTFSMRAPSASLLRVLDVGCGNGRFEGFLRARLERPFEYVGVDASKALLDEACAHSSSSSYFHEVDLVSSELDVALAAEAPFDLVVAMGLLHHIPSSRRRRAIVDSMQNLARDGGLIVFAFWRFGDRERWQKRILPWSKGCARAGIDIDERELERGDHLLLWRDTSVRYCHFADDDEIAELTACPRMSIVDTFDADGETGDSNRYVVALRCDE